MQRTTHRSLSSFPAWPTPVRRRGRRETTPYQAIRGRHGRWWPRFAISAWQVPTGAGCCWPRHEPTPDRLNCLQPVSTPPTCLLDPSRQVRRPTRINRRLSSLPVRVTSAKDMGRLYPGFRHCLAVADFLQPCSYGGPRHYAHQLSSQKLLHGLALERCAHGKFIANFVWDTSYRNLYWHDCNMPSANAFCNSRQ